MTLGSVMRGFRNFQWRIETEAISVSINFGVASETRRFTGKASSARVWLT